MSDERTNLPHELQSLLRLDDGDGPAAPLEPERRQAMVASVLNAWEDARTHLTTSDRASRSAAASPGASANRGNAEAFSSVRGKRGDRGGYEMRSGAASAPRPGPRRRMRMLLVAAVLLATGSAAAFFVARRAPWTAPAQNAAPAATAQVNEARRGAPQAETEDSDGEAAATAPRRARRAQDLLARANRLRAEGRYQEAAKAYLAAAERAPSAPLAQVAQVAAADLELERLDDVEHALALYRAALAVEGPLAPEARAGAARALRSLGDTRGEREALEDLLRAHPDSPSADWATRRLQALDGP